MRQFTVLAFAAALPWTAFAFQADFNWTGTLSPGQTLEIKGVSGGIRAELATGNVIEVSVHKTARRSDPNSVRIEVVPTSNGITICSVYPSSGSRRNECESGDGDHSDSRENDVSVDFTVKVPAAVNFSGKTVNGTVTATGLKSDVNASSVNGNVKVATTGLAHAKSVNGSIEVVMGAASWNGSLEFKTVNGSIDLSLPAGVNADIQATSVSGSFTSDFPLTVTGKIESRKTEARMGSGGNPLKLSTVNGAITLHQGTGRTI